MSHDPLEGLQWEQNLGLCLTLLFLLKYNSLNSKNLEVCLTLLLQDCREFQRSAPLHAEPTLHLDRLQQKAE